MGIYAAVIGFKSVAERSIHKVTLTLSKYQDVNTYQSRQIEEIFVNHLMYPRAFSLTNKE